MNGPFVRLIIRNCSITHHVLNFASWHFLLRQIDESKAKQESGEKKVEHVLVRVGGDGDAITGSVTETSRVNKPPMNQSLLGDETRGMWRG